MLTLSCRKGTKCDLAVMSCCYFAGHTPSVSISVDPQSSCSGKVGFVMDIDSDYLSQAKLQLRGEGEEDFLVGKLCQTAERVQLGYSSGRFFSVIDFSLIGN